MTTIGELKRLLALLPDETTVWVLDDLADAPLAIELCGRTTVGPTVHPIQDGQVSLLAYPATRDYREVCDALHNLPSGAGGSATNPRRCLRCGHLDVGRRGWMVDASGLCLCASCVAPSMITHPASTASEGLDGGDESDPWATEDSLALPPPVAR